MKLLYSEQMGVREYVEVDMKKRTSKLLNSKGKNAHFNDNSVDLETQDNCPNETKNKAFISIQDIFSSNVFELKTCTTQ